MNDIAISEQEQEAYEAVLNEQLESSVEFLRHKQRVERSKRVINQEEVSKLTAEIVAAEIQRQRIKKSNSEETV